MTASNDAIYFLHIHAKPKSHQGKVEHWIEEGGKYRLQLRIMAPPEGGKANKAIIALLAKTLDIAKSNITLVSGATVRRKTFKIVPWSVLLAEKLPKRNPLPTLF
ncbi:MAG: DUF167 domain-containing protein [Candidatus Cardinium sp.]|uniref:DUF167 domain-containing protein n=1 Tax=Cardinium endosymbiont of Dermatophagoides farinae TaxID=2597823 RepID=UPI001183DCFF|nr:DUF167 domain-containing protein [Cardinium endosymbiont of Dermatophagoides farinae]TSJ80699.1 DUF167 domain-containing protein [Cardinium endosymbiont of Dermatophagoides farinae]UWW96693.1 MAG: DUF167 domain-containing protein [Candidatus Cardinium sp.]